MNLPCRWLIFVLIIFCTHLLFAQDEETNSPFDEVTWLTGPASAQMDEIAEINIPEGYIFADGHDTRILMEAMGNPASYEEVGMYCPEEFDWFVVFEFEDIGFVEDDEKDELDAEAMLESIIESNEEGNKIRQERGYSRLFITGWEVEPHYNELTQNLEWAIRGEDEAGGIVLNYNTRVLGRSGVMRVTLVASPEQISTVMPEYKTHMAGFAFQSGEKYTEFQEGDKIAEYGLTALVVGGAAAVAAKSGLFKWLWKIALVVFVAVGGYLKKFFGRKDSE